MLTLKQARRLFDYNPKTGAFTWRERTSPASRIAIGAPAGWTNAEGYRLVMAFGQHYMLHTLIWFYMTGKWPEKQVDHKDRCKSNNRWSNLRLATNKQNQENMNLRKDNTSGCRGVWWRQEVGKWRAFIRHNGRLHHLGHFSKKADAIRARRAAERQLFTHA